MRRLFTLILTLCFVFTAFTGTAILIGRQQPLPEHLAMLHLTECAPPCWIGIVPGATTLDEAALLIRTHYVNLPDYQTIISGSLTSYTIQVSNPKDANDTFNIVIHSYDNGKISTIGFDTYGSRSSPNVGELSDLLGPPTSVTSTAATLYNGIITYTLAFSAHDCIMATTVPYPDNYATLFQHPSSFYFGERGGCNTQERQSLWQPWHGFKTFDGYSR